MSMRFHDDQWAAIRAEARRLEVPYSDYLRGAITFYIAYQAGIVGRGGLEARVARLERIEAVRRAGRLQA